MVDFSTLKKDRQKSFDSLTQKLASGNNSNQKDDRYWKVTRDAAGNGSAIIRFLPAAPDGEEPYVLTYDHGFQDPSTGKYYIEKSLNTINQPDPMSELNTKLWSEGQKDQVRRQKRRAKYHANILVVKDPANPENDGKVFIFEFGKKILEKLTDVMQKTDELDDEVKFNPFDLWDGANFRLRVSKVDDYPNYDKSKFEAPSPIADDDDEIEKIWRSSHSLAFLTDPANFKTYEELQKRMNDVLGLSDSAPARANTNTNSSKPRSIADEDEDVATVTTGSKSAEPDEENEEDLEAWLQNLSKE